MFKCSDFQNENTYMSLNLKIFLISKKVVPLQFYYYKDELIKEMVFVL